MAKKKVRNKARDVIGDYWRTNRRAERDNEQARAAQEREKGSGGRAPWSTGERIMLVVIIAGLIGIVLRYVVFR
ncbi:MAG: hypothetical protein ACOX41_08345 [Anaerovoracaceae bacterium]|jgi:hypothetical protein